MPERTNFEIINNKQVTPQRLHALVRLVARRQKPSREDILTMLQPSMVSPNTKASAAVFAATVRTELIVYDTAEDCVSLSSDLKRNDIEHIEGFRWIMQQKLCGVTDPDEDNYLLNQIVAWYAVQETTAYRLKKSELAIKFNQELYPQYASSVRNVGEDNEDGEGNEDNEDGEEDEDDDEFEEDSDVDEDDGGRAINSTKLEAWFRWATFLGWGIVSKNVLWPVAHRRLLPVLKPLWNQSMRFSDFMDYVASACPELDGGSLFDECWQASRPAYPRGQQLSFMLSTALSTLHGLKRVRLERSADAQDRWQIYPSAAFPFSEVTHIEIVE